MSDLTITEFDPQSTDSERMLLARLLAFQSRASVRGTLLASAARTTTTSSSTIDCSQYKGLLVYLNVSVASGTGGLNARIDYLDPVTGTWFGGVYGPSAPKTTTGTMLILFGDGPAVGTNAAVNPSLTGFIGAILGSSVRVSILASDASSYTYSVGYELIP